MSRRGRDLTERRRILILARCLLVSLLILVPRSVSMKPSDAADGTLPEQVFSGEDHDAGRVEAEKDDFVSLSAWNGITAFGQEAAVG